MSIAIYARVSDDKLKQDGERRQDVDRQIAKAKAWLQIQEPGKTPLLFVDDGLSAFKEDYHSRPQFVSLLREIRAKRVQRVIVEDLTRWSRRVEDGLKTMHEAALYGCSVTSLAEGEVDVTQAPGWFRCAIAFVLAEWASRSMSDKVKSGMERSKAKGIQIGRHRKDCQCPRCLEKKGRSKKGLSLRGEILEEGRAAEG